FGTKPPQRAVAMAAPANSTSSDGGSSQSNPEATVALAALNDRNRPEAERIAALRALTPLPDSTVVPVAIAVLRETGRSAALGEAAIEALSLQMMFGQFDHQAHHAIIDAL